MRFLQGDFENAAFLGARQIEDLRGFRIDAKPALFDELLVIDEMTDEAAIGLLVDRHVAIHGK